MESKLLKRYVGGALAIGATAVFQAFAVILLQLAVLSILILGPVMKWSMQWEKPILEKWGLCKNE